MKKKMITIRPDQEEWLNDHHVNLSSLVREKLDEFMEEQEHCESTDEAPDFSDAGAEDDMLEILDEEEEDMLEPLEDEDLA